MKYFFSLLFITLFNFSYSQITVDNTQSAQDLVELLFNSSGCASISNFSVSGNNSYASFNKNGSNFPFEEGIVLSTGKTNHIPGPNNSLSDDNLGTANDTDLSAIFSDTHDTTVLEFDFIPLSSYMSFEYIFASEEYQENDSNTCVYSDVFAFLIKKNTDTNYTNIALVPGTDIPVQVTTVHPDVTSSCQAENEAYFGQWNSQTDPTIPINYNGQTAVMKAESTVEIGETYHIKLVIADHANYRYDSAVFLKAGSFNIGTDLGVDKLLSTQNALCGSENLILDSNTPTAIQHQWSVDYPPYDNIYTSVGGNTQTYTVTSAGKYKVEVDLGGGCISEGEIIIEYENLPLVYDTEITTCNNDLSDFGTFDLSNTNDYITNNDFNLIVENYYHSITDANLGLQPITDYQTYTNTLIDEEVFARIENQNGCASIAKIKLTVYHNPKLSNDEAVFYCLNTYPNTINIDSGLLIGNPVDYNYKWLFDDGTNPQIDLLQNANSIDILNTGIYTVEVTNANNCTVTRNITVTNSNIATIIDYTVSETFFTERISVKINAIGEGDYEYAIDDYNFQDSPVFDHILYGHHIITVKDKNGCIPNAQKEVTILKYQKFFSPNNDDHYDYWNLNNTNSLLVHYNTISDITIYDRFGKIMAIINPKEQGWNGYYNGTLSEPADYWFSVDLIDFKGKTTTKKGNFSLVR